jgi:CRP-like cAMP-binding protein
VTGLWYRHPPSPSNRSSPEGHGTTTQLAAMTVVSHPRLVYAYLLGRNIRYEEDLVDQLFNSSEKRLARTLLLLAHFGKEGVPETVVPKISQETPTEMVGTTRSRVSFFMNRFRKLGCVDYGESGMQVHSSTSEGCTPRLAAQSV